MNHSVKPSLVLIPGLVCAERLQGKQIAALSGCAEITVADIRSQDRISEMATAVPETAPPRFPLAGFSLGGQVALEIMRTSGESVDRPALQEERHRRFEHCPKAGVRFSLELRPRGLSDGILVAVEAGSSGSRLDCRL
jgi:hypothetical protein